MKRSLLIAGILIFSLLACGCTTFNGPSEVSSTPASISPQHTSNISSNAMDGAIMGRVLDENGIDLVNASVTLRQNGKIVNTSDNPQWTNMEDLPPDQFFNYFLNATLNNAFNNTSNVSLESYYRFDNLAPGQYEITAETGSVEGSINISVDDNTTISNVTLPIYLFNKSSAKVILQIENYSDYGYAVKVLFSNDSNIPQGYDCGLTFGQPVDYMVVDMNPSILVPGVIVGINNYEFSSNNGIYVNVPLNTLWTDNVTLLNVRNVPAKYTDSLYQW